MTPEVGIQFSNQILSTLKGRVFEQEASTQSFALIFLEQRTGLLYRAEQIKRQTRSCQLSGASCGGGVSVSAGWKSIFEEKGIAELSQGENKDSPKIYNN